LDLAAGHAAEGGVDQVVRRGARVLHEEFPDEAARQGEEAGFPVRETVRASRLEEETALERVQGLIPLEAVAIEVEAGLEVLADRVPRDARDGLVLDVPVVEPGQ